MRHGRSRGASSESGFTIAELITVVAIIGILASVAVPVVSFGMRRQKELELHERIRKITDAIDRYHELRMATPPNNIKKPPDFGQREYPKNLEELIKPIELNSGKSVRLLRQRDLIDPMTNKSEWDMLSDNDDPTGSIRSGDNVFEVRSKSTSVALDGKTHYNEW
jgi:general secretion pathway protein G